jgi:hypothetical protein
VQPFSRDRIGTPALPGRWQLANEENLPMVAKDAIALLKADHRKVEELFEKYETARSKKADIAKQICMELTIHTIIEEEIFYRACRGAVEDDELDEAQVEHDGAKVLIAELEEGSPEDEYYDAKVKVLSEEIRHHVKEEEKPGGIFSQAKKEDLDLKALGEQLQVRKDELVAQFEEKGISPPVTRSMTATTLEQGRPVA